MPSPRPTAGRPRAWALRIEELRAALGAWLDSPGRAARVSDEELQDIMHAAHTLGATARWEIDRREAAKDAADSAASIKELQGHVQ